MLRNKYTVLKLRDGRCGDFKALTKSMYDLTNFLQFSKSMLFSSTKLFILLLSVSRCDMFNSDLARRLR